MINAIQDVLMQLLNFLYGFTGNYGWSLILLAVVIKVLLYVPTQQQFQAMKDMAAVQPEIKKLQERHKADPKKMQAEQMELFKKHKINPLGGCLPILIQLPILWGIWGTIMKYKGLFEKVDFFWIGSPLSVKYPKIVAASLASPDLPMLLLYAVSMYLSQALTVTDKATAQTQKTMNIIMPVMFTYFMWAGKFPSALILYWLVFNILSIFQQVAIIKQPSRVAVSIQNHNEIKEKEKK